MPALLTFECPVSTAGYHWVPADQWNLVDGQRFDNFSQPRWLVREPWNPLGKKTPRLLLRPKGEFGRGYRTVRPIVEDSGLYRNFAALEPSPEQIVQFADCYGTLWETMVGEPFHEWEFEIRTMRFLTEVWDAAETRRTGVIAKHFRTDTSGRVSYPFAKTIMDYEPFGSLSRPAALRASDYAVAAKGAPLPVARSFVIQAVNRRLNASGARIELDRFDVPYRLTIQPSNLLGALWLQFALSISERRTYQQCEACGRYMELSPDVNRADRRYCDNACRNRALRRRQKKVREMRKAGRPLREIAKTTRSDIETIKRWLITQED